MHRANVIAIYGFPSPQRRLLYGSQSVRDAAAALDAESRIRRLDGDLVYHDDMVKLVSNQSLLLHLLRSNCYRRRFVLKPQSAIYFLHPHVLTSPLHISLARN
jgi:7,8-dihydro-6-hydroxymethylpterin-pyrophosphokinase